MNSRKINITNKQIIIITFILTLVLLVLMGVRSNASGFEEVTYTDSTGCEIILKRTGWGDSSAKVYLYNIDIKNSSSSNIENWELELDFGQAVEKNSNWCCEIEADNSKLNIAPVFYNKTINKGDTVSVGLIVKTAEIVGEKVSVALNSNELKVEEESSDTEDVKGTDSGNEDDENNDIDSEIIDENIPAEDSTIQEDDNTSDSEDISSGIVEENSGNSNTGQSDSTSSGGEANISSICSTFSSSLTPSTGKINMPVFVVAFPDNQLTGQKLSESELEDILYNSSNSSSMTSYLKNSSYGQQTVSGDVYFYEMKNGISSYKDNGPYEILAMEVLDNFDGKVDFSKYDSDNDGHIDCFTLNIVGNDDYWYGCQATWFDNPNYSIDGVKPYNYIINDAKPVKGNEDYYVREMLHEFGHCMGLPDLYKYNTADFENMKGIAGSAMMEDMTGDYCMFSKLSLGWLKENNVKVYTSGTKTYTLHSAQTTGECILVSRTDLKSNSVYTGEYFMIQYDTPDKNMKGYLNNTTAGIRIIHIEAETMSDYYGSGAFKYNNYSQYYQSYEGIQIARLVNDGGEYLKAGSTVDFSTSNFAWYDSSQKQTIDPGITIKISKSNESGALDVTISEK